MGQYNSVHEPNQENMTKKEKQVLQKYEAEADIIWDKQAKEMLANLTQLKEGALTQKEVWVIGFVTGRSYGQL